ncbi:sialate O-acetylesterase [Laspinema olomoucense]|uniref:sialate O-acetylesterase n=1 Tax=Laspinema olomoucense TaxID=3231600 RepID=UPI0021BADDC7|nr:sialate O-acetylesterase [Laspinema sp. D3c]MCT7993935.1 sialate O-acetylesterase [Laspinema sp. D3c]
MKLKQTTQLALISTFLLVTMNRSESLFIKLFILAGQSNMMGYQSNLDDLPDRLRQSQKNVLWYDRNDEWVPLELPTEPVLTPDLSIPVPPFEAYHPEHSHKVKNSVGFGPEISLGQNLANGLNETVALVKYSRNGTNLATQWYPGLDVNGNPPDTLYPRMKQRVFQAIADLSALGYTVQVAGFFWMQGESDASHPEIAPHYESNFTHFILTIRQDFKRSNLPFIYGMVHFGNHHKKPNNTINCCGDIVRSAQFNVQTNIPNTRAVETRILSLHRDELHFDSNGILTLGNLFADAWFNIRSFSMDTIRPELLTEYHAD